MDQVFGDMSQAKKDFLEENMVTNDVLKEGEEAKLDTGREMIIMTLQNKKNRKEPESEGSEGSPCKLSKSGIGRDKAILGPKCKLYFASSISCFVL